MEAPQRKHKATETHKATGAGHFCLVPLESGGKMRLDGSGEPPGSSDDVLVARASVMIAELGRGAIQHMVDEIQRAILFGDDAAAEEHGRLLVIIERQFFSL